MLAKETGAGLGPRTIRRLASAGVRDFDVSGAGGTSWVAVEMLRAEGEQRALGERFRDWGIPTAVCVALAAPLGLRTLIASGGVASGLDGARALALGADLFGLARPVLQALDKAGAEGAEAFLAQVELELRTACLLTGSRSVDALRAAPRVLTEPLASWCAALARG